MRFPCSFPVSRPRRRFTAGPLAGLLTALLVAVYLPAATFADQPDGDQPTESGARDSPTLISRDQAVALVRQKSGGRVLRAERHVDKGRIYYKVRMLSTDGRVRDFEVDAVTGRVR